jgi:AcrR family transcriptional regulator
MTDAATRLVDALAADTDDADDSMTRILDAARDQFALFGVRRSSIDDIAKRARLSRNTVFRRLGTKDELVSAVAQRELRRVIASVGEVAAGADGVVDGVARAFSATVIQFRTNPLFIGVVSNHPDEILTLSTMGAGPLLQQAVDYVTVTLSADQARGKIPPEINVAGAAEIIVRTLHSIVLTPHVERQLHTEQQLYAFAAEQLAALLGVRPTGPIGD